MLGEQFLGHTSQCKVSNSKVIPVSTSLAPQGPYRSVQAVQGKQLKDDTRNCKGWLGGAMVLGKLPVPGRPTNFDRSRARAYCACRVGVVWTFFLSSIISYLSPSLWETA